MGLDISIRFKRKGAQPIRYEKDFVYDNIVYPIYDDNDLQNGPTFNGRYEFRCIPDFVTNERYGNYIDLESTSEDYKKLLQMIEETFKEDEQERGEYNPDNFMWYLESGDNSLFTLYGMLLKAPMYERFGWIMQLEADW